MQTKIICCVVLVFFYTLVYFKPAELFLGGNKMCRSVEEITTTHPHTRKCPRRQTGGGSHTPGSDLVDRLAVAATHQEVTAGEDVNMRSLQSLVEVSSFFIRPQRLLEPVRAHWPRPLS